MLLSNSAWVIPLKDKNDATINNAFQTILDECNRKPNKIWVDKGGEFYNRSMKSWLQKNDIEMYSTHNEGKCIVADWFFRILKNKIYEYMTLISKIVYIDKLDDIVNKCNNIHQYVKSNTYIKPSKKLMIKILNSKLVIFLEYQNIKLFLQEDYVPNWSEGYSVIIKVKKTVPWTYVVRVLKSEEIVQTFYKKNCKKKSK